MNDERTIDRDNQIPNWRQTVSVCGSYGVVSAIYLNKLVKGVDFGLAPVIAILQKLPEINARWFLLGEGEMLLDSKLTEVRATAQSYVLTILEMEKYLPVMSPAELREFEQMCIGEVKPNFNPTLVAEWQEKLAAHNESINAKFSDALCRQPKAKP